MIQPAVDVPVFGPVLARSCHPRVPAAGREESWAWPRRHVLDLTRVISGPMATRFLAACGAEVLRIDRPGSDESSGVFGRGNEIMLGKRWALLDLRTEDGRAVPPCMEGGRE
ncbi:CoA transferase [Streptomyces bobili]|uniref:CoA transferase n=1 Tax=Streptomyces bobili TaxID=67280 RepID=UPI0036FFE373